MDEIFDFHPTHRVEKPSHRALAARFFRTSVSAFPKSTAALIFLWTEEKNAFLVRNQFPRHARGQDVAIL